MTVTKELYPKCSDFGTLYKYLQDRLNQPSDAENETPTRETNKRKRQLFNMTDVKGNHVHRDSNGTPIQWGQNGPCTDTRFGTTKQKRVRFSDRPAITKQYTCSDGTIIDLSKLLQRFDVGQYFIDKEHSLLYRINVDDSETLCVPNIVAANGESIRYHIFLEMHDSPYYGHRGAAATYNAVRNKFHWPKMREDIAK